MHGKTVLITGGTGGLGVGVTAEALAQGASLIIPYLDATEVARLKQTLSSSDLERIAFIQADLLNEETVAQLIARLDRLDALIHLVGGFAMGKTHASQWVTPASLAKVICFLASEAAKDIRGAAIPVYGNL